MTEHQITSGHDGQRTNPSQRRYSKPVLTSYGSVAALTKGVGNSGADGGTAMTMEPSDRRVKQNIVRVGTHPLGIALYLFDYKPEVCDRCGRGRKFGVMADEVERVLPQAVTVGRDGYKLVNYGLLGMDRNPS